MTIKPDARFYQLFANVSLLLFDRFWDFHEANPKIYEVFRRLALEAFAVRAHYSHWAIANAARWEFNVRVDPAEDFKLPNDLIACYARFLVWNEPQLEGFFQFRRCNPERKVWPKGSTPTSPVQPQTLI